jgi:hypothetical protein
MKPARIGDATPWHQDEAFQDPAFDYEEISFWLALQPVDEANSCMAYLPGRTKDRSSRTDFRATIRGSMRWSASVASTRAMPSQCPLPPEAASFTPGEPCMARVQISRTAIGWRMF